MSWKLDAKKIGINLPPEFSLEEDEDFLYLKRGKETIATFSSKGANFKKIKREVWKYFIQAEMKKSQGK